MQYMENRRLRVLWFAMAAWALMMAALMPLRWASAQDAKPAETPAPAAAPAAEAPAPAADAPASDAAASAAPAPVSPSGTAVEEGPQQRTLLQLVISSSGWIGLVLLIVSVWFMATVINLFMNMNVKTAVPPPLVEKIDAAVKERRFQEVYDVCKDDPSYLARLVKTGVANLPNGKEEAKEAMDATSAEAVTEMEAKISYLAVVGTLGPMIGLVGTIMGMIRSFRELATAVNAQPKPYKVAEGIMEALFLTLEGIALSVPAIFFFALFRNRIAQISLEGNKVADRIIKNILAAAKQTKS